MWFKHNGMYSTKKYIIVKNKIIYSQTELYYVYRKKEG
jgi:hypothetical protein